MSKMRVASIGLNLNPIEKLTELSFKLPKGTEILSVTLEKKETQNTLWITYMAPSEAYQYTTKKTYPWKEYFFYVCECTYTEIEIHEHKYIGNININDMSYAIFYV